MSAFGAISTVLAVCVLLTGAASAYESCGPFEKYPAGTKVCIQPGDRVCPAAAPCACAAKDPFGALYACYNRTKYHCNSKVGLTDQTGKYADDAGTCGQRKTANLITNGGFETGDFTNWTIESNQGLSAVKADPHTGNFAATLTALTDGYLVQVVNTPATNCSLSFYLKGYQPRPSSAYLRVAFDQADYRGDIVDSAQLSSVGIAYQMFTGSFVGYGRPARLVFPFKWGDSSGNYFALDDVVATCVLP